MKRSITFILITAVLALSLCSCNVSKPKVISSDGNSYNLVTDKDGGHISNDGGLVVEETDSDGNSVTKVLKDYLVVSDDKILTPAYELEVPDDFEIKSSDAEPLLENKRGTIQQSVSDKTQFATDFDAYVEQNFTASKALGTTSEQIETAVINGHEFKRFSVNTTEDGGAELVAYFYFVKTNNDHTLLITLTSKDGGLGSVSDADGYVAAMEIN